MSGPVAQLVAHLHGMQGVRGSNPLRSTKIKSLPFGGGIFHYEILTRLIRLVKPDSINTSDLRTPKCFAKSSTRP